MNILLTCMAVLLLASYVELLRKGRRRKVDVEGAFEDADIPADTNVTAPTAALQVILNGNITVNFGNTIAPIDAAELSSIAFYTSPDCFYTLIIVDLDQPSANDSYLSPGLLALVVNIQNADLASGDTVACYIPPVPSPGSGVHRIVFYFLLQKGEIDPECISEYQICRIRFPLEDFIADNYLSVAAGNFFYTEFPDDLDELCEDTCEEYCFESV